MEIKGEDRWVMDQLAAIEPKWQPDAVRARHMLEVGLAPRARLSPWLMAMGAAAAICAAVLSFPQTRAMAQGLWDHYVLNRVDVIRVDLSDSPLQAHVTTNGVSQDVHDIVEAEQISGFKPYLPTSVISAAPRISVVATIVADQTIHVHDLETALARFGAADVRVPAEWEGVTLRAVIGPMVAADYPGEVQVLQTRPFSLTVPAGFAIERLAEVAFRSVGMSSRDAGTMARRFAANPAWLLDIPADEVVNIQELSLANGPALLTEEYDDKGGIARETVLRSTSDRIYAVMSPSRGLSVRIAGALP